MESMKRLECFVQPLKQTSLITFHLRLYSKGKELLTLVIETHYCM